MSIEIEHAASPTEDILLLVGELDAELNSAYAPENRHGLNIERIFQPNVMFFIARLDGESVGCGGVAFEDGLAEVKRMYMRPPARGKGVAQSILARLEQEARSRGIHRLTLETGDAQLAAMRFYQRAGFTRCGAFGAYATMSANAIQRSVFFEKLLA
jgi:putative acetyltransferase